jgi:hypothetical protein
VTTTRTGQATQTPDLHDMAARWFPLVERAKPSCPALHLRVAQVHALAQLADQRTGESLLRAAEAHNFAALIMSDCGMPALARDLCWRQFEVLRTSRPLDAATAKLTLQPVVNLGRLHIRDGDGTAAHQLLEALFEAVRSRADTIIDGRSTSFGDLVSGESAHREIVQWLWTVLLSDGTRALTRAGRWDQALQHARQHKGIGQRLLDGCQVAILAHATAADYDTAFNLIADTAAPTPWEQAVTACLAVFCHRLASQPADDHTAMMVARYLGLEPTPEHAAFHARLGLCVLDLAGDAPQVADVVVRRALDAADAYTARDVLSHQISRAHTPGTDVQALNELISASGLGRGTMPADLLNDLMDSLRISEASMTDMLTTQAHEHR